MKYDVQFVSLGPGDPDMVTVATLRLLQQADIIFCFGTGDGHVSRAADIILQLGIEYDRINIVDIDMKHDRNHANIIYDQVADSISKCYNEGLNIVVATEGDTSIFATTHYVMDRLQERQIAYTQSAGVPSFIAAASVAGLHLVKQKERLVIISGKTTSEEILRLTASDCNIVIMKLSMAHDAVAQAMSDGKDLEFHYFENVGTSRQKYSLLSQCPESFPYFSLLIIKRKSVSCGDSVYIT